MEYQTALTLNFLGPSSLVSPLAYRFSDNPFRDRETQAEHRFLSNGESSVLIQSTLTESSGANVEARLASMNLLAPVPLTLEIESEDGAIYGLTGLSFIITRDETGDLTLSNNVQDWPLRLTIVAHQATGTMSLQVELHYVGLAVQLAHDGAKFLRELAKGGTFRMMYTVPEGDTDVAFLRSVIPIGVYSGPNPRHMKLLEQLALIQNKTGAQLTIPDDGISPEEAQNIRVVASIVETGRSTYKVTPWETSLNWENAQGVLETFAPGKPIPIVMNYLEEQAMKVLGFEVPLGPVLVGIARAYMTPEDLAALRDAISTGGPGTVIRALLSPHEDCPAEAYYMRYLPVDHAAAIYRMVVFQREEREKFLDELLRASKQGTDVFITRFAELLAALRNNVPAHEASTANPLVTCSPEELLVALSGLMKDLDQKARFVLAALLFKHDVLSSGKAARFAGIDRVSFLMDLHKVGVAVIDLDEEQMESQARYVNSR